MRISKKRPKYHKINDQKRYRVNQYIRVPQVRLIDENGQNMGIVDTPKALALAEEKGLDVVEVSPVAVPPVAKIIDFSKMKYQEEKEWRKEKAKQKKIEVKGIRLSLRISEHDKGIRLNQAKKFLDQENKVKIELFLKGREKQHSNLAKEIVNKFIDSLNQSIPVTIEQPLNFQGGRLSILVAKQ